MKKKLNTQSDAAKILDVTTAFIEFGPSQAAEMINDLVITTDQAAYQRGYNEGSENGAGWRFVVDKIIMIGKVLAILLSFFGIFYYFHTIHENAAKMDDQEMTACTHGDFKGCLAGYERYVHSGYPGEIQRAKIYAEAYKSVTGKELSTIKPYELKP
jgi:hypothetical protein